MNSDLMNNLKLMGITGILFAIFSVYATINFILSQAIEEHTAPSVIFIGLAIASAIYATVSLKKYTLYKRDGERAKPNLIYGAMILGYIAILVSTIYYDIWVAPWGGVPVVFVAFLAGSILLLPPYPLMSSVLALAMLAVYFITSFIVVVPDCCWVCGLSDAAFGVIIGIVLMWYINMHKMVATHSTLLMRDERDKYVERSITDELTRLHNYRDFIKRLERYLTSHRASDKYMCLAVMDIDRFKQYNDHYGHPQGDECLRLIGEALGEEWEENPGMYAARIGGEEFALLWFEEYANDAKKVSEEIQRRIYALQIPHEMSDIAPYVTFSIGIDMSRGGTYDSTRAAYAAADNALYDAKESGRNNAVLLCEGEKWTT